MMLHHYTFRAMGTVCGLQLYAESQGRADMLAALAISEVERIEKKYSRYLDDSFLTQINRAAQHGETIEIDVETAGLVDFAFACFQKSGGVFDVTAGCLRHVWDFSANRLPSKSAVSQVVHRIGMDKLVWNQPYLSFSIPGMDVDFGGIAKEYAADNVARLLQEEGVAHGLVDLGGDMVALGPHPDERAWKIAVRDPFNAQGYLGEVALSQGAIATSGNYERCIEINGQRYGHILDPKTGWSVMGLASVTVVASQCMLAGSVSTIAMLKGRAGIDWLAGLGLPCQWVDDNGRHGGTLPPVSI